MADKPKILIVDDIAEYAMAFEMYLPEGAESLCASSADEAKTLLAANAPVDLAVVDVRLDGERDGDTSGMELLSWMRETYPRMPVVMVSAYQTFEYEIEALERGAFRFLKKPLQPVEVKAALKEVLGI